MMAIFRSLRPLLMCIAAGTLTPAFTGPVPDAALNSTATCCNSLTAALESKVSFPGSAAYNSSTSSYWALQESLVSPSCILSANSTQDVATALRILVPQSCKFAVRSGGHGAIAGIANIQDGVTIDLSGLDFITPSSDRSLVAIGPGQNWGNVYTSLDSLNVSVPGGRDGPVGVGGSALGGGFGYFATKAGFSCDNVVEYEVVLANSSTVIASNVTNSDLWLALKGGSSNFGIVTKFVFRTFPLGLIWGGDAYFPNTTHESQLSAFHDFTSNPYYDVDAGLILNLAFTPATGILLNNQYAYARPIINPPAFQGFTSIPGQLENNTAVLSLGTFSKQEGLQSPDGYEQITFAVTFKNTLLMLQKVWEIYNASTLCVSSIEGIQWTISLEPLIPAITAQSKAKGGNVLGLDHVPSEGLVLAILSATFSAASDYSSVSTAADELLNNIISAAKEYGVFNSYVDTNHAAASQDPIASYGEQNELFLAKTAKKYDPSAVFQILMPGGFKI